MLSPFLLVVALLSISVSATDRDIEIQKRQSVALGTGPFLPSSASFIPSSVDLTPTPTLVSLTSPSVFTPPASSRPSSTPASTALTSNAITQGSSSPSSTSPSSSTTHSSTSSSRGELVLGTTDSSGHSTTLYGAAASSYASSHRLTVYSSALIKVTEAQTVVPTTKVVNGVTSVGSATVATHVTETTGYAEATNPAQLADDGESSSSSGLSSSDKKIIGGVVGGVGGALLLGGLLVVFWRLRKRGNKNDDYDYSSNYGTGNLTQETPSGQGMSQGSNAGDGLERYHNPDVANAPPPHSSTNF